MIYVKQQSPCIGECQNPRPGVDVTFHANSELFIIEKKDLHLNKTDCDFHIQHLTIYHLIVIRVFLVVGN